MLPQSVSASKVRSGTGRAGSNAAIPVAIYRFSATIYDRSAERVSQLNYFHQLLRLAAINPLSAIPALAGA
jgi:hypothetical protein